MVQQLGRTVFTVSHKVKHTITMTQQSYCELKDVFAQKSVQMSTATLFYWQKAETTQMSFDQ